MAMPTVVDKYNVRRINVYSLSLEQLKSDILKNLTELHLENLSSLPDKVSAATPWKVNIVWKEKSTHYVIVFTYVKKSKSFFIHVIHSPEDELADCDYYQVVMEFGMFNNSHWFDKGWKMVDHGNIQKSMEDIFIKAFEVMSKMGQYDILINNCQTFARDLAKELGASKKVNLLPKTDILLFRGQSLYKETTEKVIQISYLFDISLKT